MNNDVPGCRRERLFKEQAVVMKTRQRLSIATAILLFLAVLSGCIAPRPSAPRHLVAEIPKSPMFGDSQGSKMNFVLPSIDKSVTELTIEDNVLTCNLHNAPLEKVLELINAQSKLQFVHRGRLHGRISAQLEGVPLESALATLFQTTPYSATLNGDVYLIDYRLSPDGNVKPVVQEVFFTYVDVAQVLDGLLEAYGRVSDPAIGFGRLPGSNGIFVVAPADHMDGILEFLQGMDRERPQVLIEALVVEFFTTDILEIGARLSDGIDADLSEVGINPGSSIAPLLSFLFNKDGELAKQFRVELNALVEQGDSHVVSRPYVVTRSGNPATIKSQEILTVRSEQLDSGERLLSTDDIKAGTSMEILPIVNPDNTVTLQLNLEQSEFVQGFGTSDAGVVARRVEDTAVVNLNVKNGETVVLGGFIRTEGTGRLGSVPILNRIPVLKYLFGNWESIDRESEVVFILTPHLMPIEFKEFYERPLPTHKFGQ